MTFWRRPRWPGMTSQTQPWPRHGRQSLTCPPAPGAPRAGRGRGPRPAAAALPLAGPGAVPWRRALASLARWRARFARIPIWSSCHLAAGCRLPAGCHLAAANCRRRDSSNPDRTRPCTRMTAVGTGLRAEGPANRPFRLALCGKAFPSRSVPWAGTARSAAAPRSHPGRGAVLTGRKGTAGAGRSALPGDTWILPVPPQRGQGTCRPPRPRTQPSPPQLGHVTSGMRLVIGQLPSARSLAALQPGFAVGGPAARRAPAGRQLAGDQAHIDVARMAARASSSSSRASAGEYAGRRQRVNQAADSLCLGHDPGQSSNASSVTRSSTGCSRSRSSGGSAHGSCGSTHDTCAPPSGVHSYDRAGARGATPLIKPSRRFSYGFC